MCLRGKAAPVLACVGVCDPRREGVGVSLSGAWVSADLGCSSEYSMERMG